MHYLYFLHLLGPTQLVGCDAQWLFNLAEKFFNLCALKEPVVINRVSMLRQLARVRPGPHGIGRDPKYPSYFFDEQKILHRLHDMPPLGKTAVSKSEPNITKGYKRSQDAQSVAGWLE